jgi:hypothetical protein
MCIVALKEIGIITNCLIYRTSLVAIFPAVKYSARVKYSGGSGSAVMVAGVLVALAWSSFIAYALHRAARLVTADDFSWSGFWGGVVFGFLPGALVGCRVWIWIYQFASLTTCLVLGGLVGGFTLGVYMGSCWSKARYE